MFFGQARAAYLEFLRNIFPQIMLFAIALVLSTKLNLTRILPTVEGVENAFPFVAILILLVGAMLANTSLFLQKAALHSRAVRRVIKLSTQNYKKTSGTALYRLRTWFWAGFRYNKAGLFESIIAAAIAEIGLIVMFISIIPMAENMLQMLQNK